jgi:hypothetical protein
MIKKIAGIFAALLILLVVAGIYLLSKKPALPPAPPTQAEVGQAQSRLSAALAPEPVVNAPAPSSSATNLQIDSQRAVSNTSQGNGIRTIRISDNDINVVLAGDAGVISDMKSKGLTNAHIKFADPSNVSFSATVQKDGHAQSITIDGTLATSTDGDLSYSPHAVRLGALPLPESTFDKLIRRECDGVLKLGIQRLPISVQTVAVKNHQLILSGPSKQS